MSSRLVFLLVGLTVGCSEAAHESPPPPLPPPPPTVESPPPPEPPEPSAPAGYPEAFPFIAGGSMQAAPPGPAWLAQAMVTYADRAPADLRDALRARLTAEGWTIEGEETSPRGTLRMRALQGERQIQVSVLPGPDGAGAALLLVGR